MARTSETAHEADETVATDRAPAPVRGVPTQRTAPAAPVSDAPATTVPTTEVPARVALPTQRTAPSSERPDERLVPAAPRRVRRRLVGVLAGAAAVALVATGTGAWAVNQRAQENAAARQEARDRVDQAVAGRTADRVVDGAGAARPEVATLVAARTAQAAQLTTAADAAAAVLTSTPHAGDAHAALQGAIDGARRVAVASDASLVELRTAATALVGPQQAASEAEAAWVEQDRQRQAAEAAAQAQQPRGTAARSGASTTRRSTSSAGTTKAGTSTGSKSSGAKSSGTKSSGTKASTSPRSIPAGGLVCQGTGGSAASEASATSLGSAINAYRAKKGLSKLKIVRSGTLVSHAKTMGVTGGIWHSGGDNIVGCAGSSNPSYLVSAWAASPAHDKQMRRTDATTMYVGAATEKGWLFGAVLFR